MGWDAAKRTSKQSNISKNGDKQVKLLTVKARVLIEIYRDPTITVQQIASNIQVTTRVTQSALSYLRNQGLLTSRRVGRNNTYICTNTDLCDALEESRKHEEAKILKEKMT